MEINKAANLLKKYDQVRLRIKPGNLVKLLWYDAHGNEKATALITEKHVFLHISALRKSIAFVGNEAKELARYYRGKAFAEIVLGDNPEHPIKKALSRILKRVD